MRGICKNCKILYKKMKFRREFVKVKQSLIIFLDRSQNKQIAFTFYAMYWKFWSELVTILLGFLNMIQYFLLEFCNYLLKHELFSSRNKFIQHSQIIQPFRSMQHSPLLCNNYNDINNWSTQEIPSDDETGYQNYEKGKKIVQIQQKDEIISQSQDHIKSDKWTKNQLDLFYTFHNEFGNKWSKISQVIQRDDNCIKNYFYSTQRRALRKLNKIIQTRKIKGSSKIKYSILNKILQTAQCKFLSHNYPNVIVKNCVEIKNIFFKFDELILKDSSPIVKEILSKITEVRNFFSRRNKNKKKYPMNEKDQIEFQLQEKKQKIDVKNLKKGSLKSISQKGTPIQKYDNSASESSTLGDLIEYPPKTKGCGIFNFKCDLDYQFSYDLTKEINLQQIKDIRNPPYVSYFNTFFENDINFMLDI